MEKIRRLVDKRDGKNIVDIEEYHFAEGYFVAQMDDGTTRIITDEDCIENYFLQEKENEY